MKRRLPKKLSLTRETLHRLQTGDLKRAVGALPTTPIGTCPETDPAVCGGTGEQTNTPLPCRPADS
jgi:hypothetical protein